MTAHTQAEMLADLRATFPTLKARPMGPWISSERSGSGGVRVMCDDAVRMPDGLPILTSDIALQALEEFDGAMHTGFYAWLSRRGWYYESYDGVVMFLLPTSTIPEYESAPGGLVPSIAYGESPF